MRFLTLFLAVLAPLLAMGQSTELMLFSTSLNTCQPNSGFTASQFQVFFTPGNNTVQLKLKSLSTIEGKIIVNFSILAYGIEIKGGSINPCDLKISGFCPMNAGQLPDLDFQEVLDSSVSSMIPSIAYNFPDIDAKVRITINSAETKAQLACIEAPISNGKTVDLVGVKWATALVVGLALVSSAALSTAGHYNAASHVAASALSLVGFYQSMALIGMIEVPLPPVVQAWTQDFQWSLGVVNVGFLQDIFTWYLRATGGTPSHVLNSVGTVSVEVQKRGLELVQRGLNHIKRGEVQTGYGAYVISGPDRVAFRENMDATNIFLTGIVTYVVVMIFSCIFVALAKFAMDGLAKIKVIKHDRFIDFRSSWLPTLKGVLYRITLIGFPAICFLCLLEFKRRDSAALVVVAVAFIIGTIGTLVYAAYTVIVIARRSIVLHKNPAYSLFAEDSALNRWGFLYIQFRASAYYFVSVMLGYMFIKSLVIAVASGIGLAIALMIVEAAALIGASVMRPWMDKKMNSFNIAICAINFFNTICILIYTQVFGQPTIVTSVAGVVFWVVNAVFTLVLLLMIIISTLFVLFRENPDTRYRFMGDDRTSFVKSQSHLATNNELDALGMAARGSDTKFTDNDGPGLPIHGSDPAMQRMSMSSSFGSRPHSRPQSVSRPHSNGRPH
ncbi:Transient receptor potential (TRP) ion channel [Microdochium nivale]|nr:Transient receptor potential (TRP) ion channel [Microdochium nivale]